MRLHPVSSGAFPRSASPMRGWWNFVQNCKEGAESTGVVEPLVFLHSWGRRLGQAVSPKTHARPFYEESCSVCCDGVYDLGPCTFFVAKLIEAC